MRAILIIGNIKEEGIEDIAQPGEVIVIGLAQDGLKHYCCCGKDSGDLFWCHGGAREDSIDQCVVRRQVNNGVVR